MANRTVHNINFTDANIKRIARHNIYQTQTRGNNEASINKTAKTATNIIVSLYTKMQCIFIQSMFQSSCPQNLMNPKDEQEQKGT